MRFKIWIVAPPGDTAWQCLQEVAVGVEKSLMKLGHEVVEFVNGPTIDVNGGRLVIFNAHRLETHVDLPHDAIIFNAEQIPDYATVTLPLPWLIYLERLRNHIVWDYSETNIERLKRRGDMRAVLCGVGYYDGLSMTSIVPATTPATGATVIEDIDVLFFGSINDRRKKTILDIAGRRLRVHGMTGVYGEERDAWIARAKVVLNLHYYPNPIFEIFRCSYLFANRKCVVTEGGGCDPTLETLASACAAVTEYEKLPDLCQVLVSNADMRRQIAERGFETFRKLDQTEMVMRALDATSKLDVR